MILKESPDERGRGSPLAFLNMPSSAFNPSTLLTLKYRRRRVVVPRNLCSDYDVGHSLLVAFYIRDALSS